MKRILLLAVAALMFVGCNNAFEDEGNARFEQNTLPTLTAAFDEDATRTYVENNKYLRWHEGDLISVFYGTTLNSQYKFIGNTGANSGEFEPIKSDNLSTGNALDRIYAVYPYDAEATISDLGVISYSMPATQTYAEESFGRGANVMVAATESLDDRFLGFKNACGYLKIKLHGGGVVTSIKLKGNNGEKIAGNATITATYGGVPDIVMLDDAMDSIILDCGDGVELSTDAENPTEFWIVVPPIEFSKGITIVAYSDKTDYEFTKSTDSPITIERNVVQPMKSLRAEFLGHTGNDHNPSQIPNDEIWYTSTDGNIVEPYVTDVFGANIVSNAYDDGKGVIKFDGDVTTIGKQAFLDCTRLESIIIPNKVTTIGGSAFSGCTNLISVIIGNSVTTIERYAFSGCSSLTDVTIPESLTSVGSRAFYKCENIKRIYITDLVAWCKCGGLYPCESGDIYLNGMPIISLLIPDEITEIRASAFRNCSSLTSVTFHNNVTAIGDYAFYGCRSLTGVTIPDSVTTIGGSAFRNCSSLTSITFHNNVTTIGDYAFYGCDSLTSITIPNSVTTIGGNAFGNCENLKSIYITDLTAWCNIEFGQGGSLYLPM